MNRHFVSTLALMVSALVFSLPTAAVARATLQETESSSEHEIRALVQAMHEAAAKRDRAAIERYHAPGFSMIHSDGSVDSREVWIDQMSAGVLGFQASASGGGREVLEETVTFPEPDMAFLTTLARFRNEERGSVLFTRNRQMFLERNGEWRAISAQTSLIHEGPAVAVSLEGLPGRYEISQGRTFTVTEKGGTLFGTSRTGSPMPLFATGADGVFEGPHGRFRFTFLKDGDGRASGVVMARQDAEVWRARRVD